MIRTANLTASVSRNAGGLFESVRRLVQSLADTGMEVRVFGTEDEHTAADIGSWSPINVKAFRPIGPHQFGYSPHFRQALNEFKPDLVHTHGLWVYSSIVVNQYCHRKQAAYVISPHGMLDPWAVRNSRWKKAIAHFFYEGTHLSRASCLRALCESEASAIRQLGLKNPIAIIPNGIDLPIFPNAETLKPETLKTERAEGCGESWERGAEGGKRKAGGSPASSSQPPPWASITAPGQKVLLFLSRIHPKKGLVNLLQAWKQTLNSQPSTLNSWVLAIAGWDQGGHETELKRLATELGIAWEDVRERGAGSEERGADVRCQRSEVSGQTSDLRPPPIAHRPPSSVLFLGPQFNEGKAACYAHCDGFILPSFSEGVPMVVLEAWGHGKPVLMTPECNLPVGFARNAAIRIEPNVESITAGLRELLQAPSSQLQALGANGRALVREQFTWPRLGREMACLYEWLLGGGPKPDCVV